jgi:hypothetical protein
VIVIPRLEGEMMDTNPVGSLLLMVLLVLSVWGIFAAEGKWKLFNLLIIIAGIGFGLALGYLAGLWSANMALGGQLAATFGELFGGCAAYICVRRNTIRKAGVNPEP